MTYGDYQEAASTALALLLTVEPKSFVWEPDLVLASRAHIVETIVERLDHLGAAYVPVTTANHRSTHMSVVRQPLFHLAKLVDEMDRPCWGDTAAPTDVLRSVDDPGSGAANWRAAARNLFLATSELLRADDQSWLTRPETGWPLVADVADVVEGLVLLDAQLGAVGLLPSPSQQETQARLLVASDVGRIARMAEGDATADLATAGWRARATGDGSGITLVRSTSDFAEAQRGLTRLVRPLRASTHAVSSSDRPGLRTARAVAAGQASLNLAFAAWSRESGRSDLSAEFTARADLYRQLHTSTLRLVDLIPHRSTMPLIQQAELSTQLRAFGPTRMSARRLEDLNGASGGVAVALGRSLRREGLTAHHIQALTVQGDDFPKPAPITNTRHPFHVACKALADSYRERDVDVPVSERTQRRDLRAVLDRATVPGSRPLRRMPASTATAGRGLP